MNILNRLQNAFREIKTGGGKMTSLVYKAAKKFVASGGGLLRALKHQDKTKPDLTDSEKKITDNGRTTLPATFISPYEGDPNTLDFRQRFEAAWSRMIKEDPHLELHKTEDVRYDKQVTQSIKTRKGFYMQTDKYLVLSEHGNEPPHPYQIFMDAYPDMEKTIVKKLAELKSIKLELKLWAEDTDLEQHWITNQYPLEITQGQDWKDTFFNDMVKVIHKATMMGTSTSMWKQANAVAVTFTPNRPASGGRYIPNPKSLANRKGIVNVRNKDDRCFQYAVCAALHSHRLPVMTKWRPSSYDQFINVLSWSDMEFPATVQDIKQFEHNNDIACSVFGWNEEDKSLFMIYHTKKVAAKSIELVLVSEMMDGELCHHYVAMTQRGNVVKPYRSHATYNTCPTCPQTFTTKKGLEDHLKRGCARTQEFKAELVMPSKLKNSLSFCDPTKHKERRHPFVMYADFESMLVPLENGDKRHEIMSYGLSQFVYTHARKTEPIVNKTVMRRKDQTADEFINEFTKDVKEISWQVYRMFTKNEALNATKEVKRNFNAAKKCCLCKRKFDEKSTKAMHHEHPTGMYLGAAHQTCNLFYHDFNFVNKIFFHNFKNYDSHFIVRGLGSECNTVDGMVEAVKFDGELTALAQNSERLRELRWKPTTECFRTQEEINTRQKPSFTIEFKDTCALYPCKLEGGVQELRKVEKMLRRHNNGTVFPHTRQLMLRKGTPDTPNNFDLLQQKGVYPYSFVDSLSKMDLPMLPSREQFYDELSKKPCSKGDYEHAQKVWQVFDCKSLKDYHDLYLELDVALLADMFENYRDLFLAKMKLDPVHYVSLPQMAWDAFLKFYKGDIKLMTDMDKYEFFEKSIRGGVTFTTRSGARANNPKCAKYDPTKPKKWLAYLDANSLYPHVMRQMMPHDNFTWVPKHQLGALISKEVSETSQIGYQIEVDMELDEADKMKMLDYGGVCERKKIDDYEMSSHRSSNIE